MNQYLLGRLNRYKYHYWAAQNPRWFRKILYQPQCLVRYRKVTLLDHIFLMIH